MKLQRVNINSVILVKVCTLVMMVIAYSGCGTDPPPPPPPDNPWEPCQCDAPMYEIIVPSRAERITITPDKPLYGKGELVSITYEPLGDELFTYWRVFPYSHLGSESESSTIYIYMTDHTSIVPNWKPRFVSVTARTNISYGGSVYREPDMGLYEYGTEVALTAIPAPGYRLKRWASDTGALMNNGYRYESTITVKATAGYIYTAEFEPTTIPPPPLPTFTGKVTVTGGTADIFTASDDSSVEPASYYHDSCGVYWTFLARCDIDPGYDFVYWRCDPPRNDIPEYYVYNEPQLNMELNAFGSAGDTVTFEAHLTKTVNLDIEIQGQGVVTSPDFRAYWNPQLYFTGKYIDGNPPPPRTDSNRVQMTADPCPGWGFHHWEIKDAGGQWQTVTWYNPLKKIYEPDTRPISVYMNWWGSNSDLMYLPAGEETHYVKAVFSPYPPMIITPVSTPTATQFTYSNGLCLVNAQAAIESCFDYIWSLTPIAGSLLTSIPNPPNQATVEFTYTGLPSNNDDFGKKELKITDTTNGLSDIREIRIFFAEEGTDHPPVTNAEGPDFYQEWPWPNPPAPNWFYYWRQTNAGSVQPTPLYYGFNTSAQWDAQKQKWCIFIGANSNMRKDGTLKAEPNLKDPTINNGIIQYEVEGIDTFAWDCRHEASHVVSYEDWYPNGAPPWSSGDDDSIPDSVEIALGYDPSNADSNGDGLRDCEDWVIRNQEVWENYDAQESDWANPGQQYDDGC